MPSQLVRVVSPRCCLVGLSSLGFRGFRGLVPNVLGQFAEAGPSWVSLTLAVVAETLNLNPKLNLEPRVLAPKTSQRRSDSSRILALRPSGMSPSPVDWAAPCGWNLNGMQRLSPCLMPGCFTGLQV